MTPERWQHIKQVYFAALEYPPGERASFIDSACSGDETARREVSQLISAHELSGDFLDSPAYELAATSLVDSQPEALVEGQLISHYQVIQLLGVGGMGEVYLAEDTRLGRRVALKLLPASFTTKTDRVRRFEREARAASSLSHPNVCMIHEVGEAEDGRHYIVMEYVEGVTLRRHMDRRRMEVTEILDAAIQIANGLAAAHAVGVVHRDVKPENVMLRPDGIVKVLDFGLAKLCEQRSAVDSTLPTQPRVQTEAGVVMGTAQYMSPEQARGQEVDHRTDIWSLGVVLYEMLTGHPPFEGETPSHVIVSILETEPAALSSDHRIPAEPQRIVEKALCKDRQERYQTAREFALDLKSLKEELELQERLKRAPDENASGKAVDMRSGEFGVIGSTHEQSARTGHITASRSTSSINYLLNHKTLAGITLLTLLVGTISLSYFLANRNKADSGARSKKSIAVLPLKPINISNRDEIYEIGIADSLIHRLSAVKELVVRPLSATRSYTDITQDPLAAGKEQQTDYVLASNYQLADGKIRVTAQLLNVSNGQVEETYKSEKNANDIFAIEDAIARDVGDLLLARFATTSSTATTRGTISEEAYRLYLQGMYLVEKENLADAKRAVELFDQALSLDSNYAKAWAGKARAHCSVAHWGGSSPVAEFMKAKPALDRALAIDANLPEAYGVLGVISADYDWNFSEAEKHFLRAIELTPNSDLLYRWYANRLAGQGRSEESIARIKTAIDLNPNSVFHHIMYGRTLYYARRYDDAITQLQRVIEMDSDSPIAYHLLWRSYHMKGDYQRAYESFIRFQKVTGTKDEMLRSYETAYTRSGWRAVLLRYLEILQASNAGGSNAYKIAVLSALLGQREHSFHFLNEAVSNRSLEIPNIAGEPALDPLRGDARFAEIVRRIGLQ